ncbi:DNA-3-methyladenine glycosylase 2 family protein [Cryobacterium frigoriphilum]|uniref:DNA-3-methyladenine glycosylase 2 family protein n=1 Tax=Cryobacterium frigoriphilum TaxID=1259150 RepID=A0A4R9A6Q0_9MICO|nr:DNA-3-methyladenine glycosylase 2 family protein [Cryobacterium frigoriphilum]
MQLTLSRLRRGATDPTHQVAADGALWRTTLTVDGPASMRFTQHDPHTLTCEAWGAGAHTAVAAAAALMGEGDDPTGFVADHPRLHDAHRRYPGLRIPRTGQVLESLIPAILEQKVISVQATASWRSLVRAHGTPAPGPTPLGMLVAPSNRAWQLIPSWEWHRAGVDPQRSRTVMQALQVARQLQAAVTLSPQEATARLRTVPGIGVWTAAEVAQRAFGDADALSVGDYHLSNMIGHSLFGRDLTDAEMIEAMVKWQPHRYRVVRLLEVGGATMKPRRGPRLSFVDHRRH